MKHVNISGMNSDMFNDGVKNLYLWDARLSRQFPADVWAPWNTLEDDMSAVQLSNRILTPSFLCQGAPSSIVPDELGKGTKKLVEEGQYKYLPENEICLYEHVVTGKGLVHK